MLYIAYNINSVNNDWFYQYKLSKTKYPRFYSKQMQSCCIYLANPLFYIKKFNQQSLNSNQIPHALLSF
jgi:hypothetical protein